jgi:transcriptional regulator with AAA-type ATPase domain
MTQPPVPNGPFTHWNAPCYLLHNMTDTVDRTAAPPQTDWTAMVVRKLRSLKLRRVEGSVPGPPQTFTMPRITMGRSRACHVMVAHPSVSALHCELRVRGEHVELRDLDSTSGTHVEGRRIYHVELRPGDCFAVGDVAFELMEAGEVEVPVSADDRFEEMWGDSPSTREVFAQLDALAETSIDVLIAGETGTGKEVAARSLHLRSGRKGAFVAHDCASLAPNALETAFQDATRGTLLLDDLSELPMELQPRLLRLLDRREAGREPPQGRNPGKREGRPQGKREPSGSGRIVDVRIVASTRTDLPKLVATHRFREDLYFRVAQAVVELPPLRERGDDVELLAAQFLAEQAGLTGEPPLELADDARLVLREHRWPGNVRELRNVILRAVHLARGPRIHAADLAVRDRADAMGIEELLALPYREAHALLDRFYLRRIMTETRGNITHAALRLGTSRRALRERHARGRLPDRCPRLHQEARLGGMECAVVPIDPHAAGQEEGCGHAEHRREAERQPRRDQPLPARVGVGAIDEAAPLVAGGFGALRLADLPDPAPDQQARRSCHHRAEAELEDAASRAPFGAVHLGAAILPTRLSALLDGHDLRGTLGSLGGGRHGHGGHRGHHHDHHPSRSGPAHAQRYQPGRRS